MNHIRKINDNHYIINGTPISNIEDIGALSIEEIKSLLEFMKSEHKVESSIYPK